MFIFLFADWDSIVFHGFLDSYHRLYLCSACTFICIFYICSMIFSCWTSFSLFCHSFLHFPQKRPSAGVRLTTGCTAAGLTRCRLRTFVRFCYTFNSTFSCFFETASFGYVIISKPIPRLSR